MNKTTKKTLGSLLFGVPLLLALIGPFLALDLWAQGVATIIVAALFATSMFYGLRMLRAARDPQ